MAKTPSQTKSHSSSKHTKSAAPRPKGRSSKKSTLGTTSLSQAKTSAPKKTGGKEYLTVKARKKASIEKELKASKLKCRQLNAELQKEKIHNQAHQVLNPRHSNLIPRPNIEAKGVKLRDEMGLSDTPEKRARYLLIMRCVRENIHAAQLDAYTDWRNQNKEKLANLIGFANEKFPELLRFHTGWPVIEIAQRYLKGIRAREQKQLKAGNLNQDDNTKSHGSSSEDEDDDKDNSIDKADSENEDEDKDKSDHIQVDSDLFDGELSD